MPTSLVPLSNIEKARAVVRLFEQGRDADAYNAMDWMLRNREWPEWLQEAASSIDALTMKEAA